MENQLDVEIRKNKKDKNEQYCKIQFRTEE